MTVSLFGMFCWNVTRQYSLDDVLKLDRMVLMSLKLAYRNYVSFSVRVFFMMAISVFCPEIDGSDGWFRSLNVSC